MKNRDVVRSRICEAVFRRFLRHVAADLTATQIAQLTGLNRNTVNRLLRALRVRMAEACEALSPLRGQVEVDESSFGPKRVRGQRVRGAGRKTPVFGIFKRQGKVYTERVPDCSKTVLQKVIRGRVDLDNVIHSNGWRDYNGLVDLGYAKHLRMSHGDDELPTAATTSTASKASVPTPKPAWPATDRGVADATLALQLKECEFRFNHWRQDLYLLPLKLCREHPLS